MFEIGNRITVDGLPYIIMTSFYNEYARQNVYIVQSLIDGRNYHYTEMDLRMKMPWYSATQYIPKSRLPEKKYNGEGMKFKFV